MADLRPLVPLTSVPVPLDGYYYLALDVDASVDPPEAYREGNSMFWNSAGWKGERRWPGDAEWKTKWSRR